MSGFGETATAASSLAATAEPRLRGRKNGEEPADSAGLGEDFRADLGGATDRDHGGDPAGRDRGSSGKRGVGVQVLRAPQGRGRPASHG